MPSILLLQNSMHENLAQKCPLGKPLVKRITTKLPQRHPLTVFKLNSRYSQSKSHQMESKIQETCVGTRVGKTTLSHRKSQFGQNETFVIRLFCQKIISFLHYFGRWLYTDRSFCEKYFDYFPWIIVQHHWYSLLFSVYLYELKYAKQHNFTFLLVPNIFEIFIIVLFTI